MSHFYDPEDIRKVFREYRNEALGWNGLLCTQKGVVPKFVYLKSQYWLNHNLLGLLITVNWKQKNITKWELRTRSITDNFQEITEC